MEKNERNGFKGASEMFKNYRVAGFIKAENLTALHKDVKNVERMHKGLMNSLEKTLNP